MAMKFDGVSESPSEYNQSGDYEHEHRPVGLSASTKNSQNKTKHRSGRSAAFEMVNFLAATR